MAVNRPSISGWDYVVFIIMLLGALLIGIFYAVKGRHQSNAQYLTGNRNLNFLPVSISMVATFYSSILLLGFPAEFYLYGGMFWLYAVGIATGAVLAVVLFVPVFHPLKLTSVNEYLLRRYNSRFVATLGTLSGVVGMILVTSIVYFAPATTVRAITGFPTWASILVGGAITICYTSIGGIRAVIWTDVFQTLLMLVGLLTMSIQAILKVGGISKVWDICEEWGRLNIIDANPDPRQRLTFWSLTIGVGFLEMNRFGIQQMAVQRYCSLPTLTKARLGVLCLLPWIAIMVFLSGLCGLTMFAYYAGIGCDPLKSRKVGNPNQLVPYFVIEILNYPGIPGIFLASVAAASLSTASSCINSSAANLWKDFLCVIWPNMSDKKNVWITKGLVVACGTVSTVLAFGFMTLGGTLIQMVVTFLSAIGGPTTGMFLLGIFVNFTNWKGATAGGFSGFILAMWMGFGAYSIDRQNDFLPTTVANCSTFAANTSMPMPTLTTTIRPEVNPLHEFYSVSYLWIACFGTLVSFFVGLLVSLVTGRMHGQKVPSELFHPWVRSCYKSDGDEKDAIDKPAEKGIEKSHVNGFVQANDDRKNYIEGSTFVQGTVIASTKI